MEWWQILSMVLGSLGGLELIKFVATRSSSSRVEAAKADAEEVKADSDEFRFLREVNTSLQELLRMQEVRFAEQTNVLRKANSDVLELTRKVTLLETERSMKLCERRGCDKRQPQSGY